MRNGDMNQETVFFDTLKIIRGLWYTVWAVSAKSMGDAGRTAHRPGAVYKLYEI